MKRAFLIAAIAAMPLLATSARAQSQTVNDTAVASVDGTKIYASDIVQLYQGLPDRYRQVPMAQIADQLLERLIDQTVLANAARKAGLDKSSTIERRIKMLIDGVLQQAYIEANIGTYLSDEMLK
ncbi:MAG: SurA N-terminal domain-containing protein, partial [Pseudomonadota bacterium]|nr:SurA N-terminal domain-containing protein [Pseudomonadota bacterium]